MAETHIAHAVATFSELGIGAGLVWLSDVVSLRSDLNAQLIVAKETRRVTQEDYDKKADGFDPTIGSLIRIIVLIREKFFACIISFLLGLIRWLPYICVGLGVYALFGISFYPTAFNFFPKFLSFDRDALDVVYFVISVLSFAVVSIPIIAMMTKKVINWYALKDIKIE